ncbi:methyltransferase domain-containing protein [Usitatibacter palustris]|uniref:Thiopurine S-methyltransferase n=1 Tax=Usitatibacter palustris TaxID=2732487 RepID=A0A6M4HAB1_9PROT|nr:methyltransferase domain-containing protein [Usitatibacter palustris]QJR14987.1 Thiopurine S-methyltransferase [Usitatibacter palustris]
MATPTFPKLDPTGAEFWEVRYREHFTPWDAGRVPKQLQDFVAGEEPPGRVLVPGCGSAHDVRFFAEAGWDVQGIDFSAAAVEAAVPILGPFASRVTRADFFGAEVAGPYPLVYERAFLCALPRREWPRWGARMAELIPSGGRIAGFFYYEEPHKPGPPFPMRDRSELHALLDPAFEAIEDREVDDSISIFVGKERWEIWRRR